MENVIDFLCQRHDVYCNQKYAEGTPFAVPYSFHLNAVSEMVRKFIHLVEDKEYETAIYGAYAHDAIEDARMTFNDIKNLAGYKVAKIALLCQEWPGETRDDRHPPVYYAAIAENKIATLVKICDIIANTTFGLTTGSKMPLKYLNEYKHKVREFLFRKDLEEVFVYADKLFDLVEALLVKQ